MSRNITRSIVTILALVMVATSLYGCATPTPRRAPAQPAATTAPAQPAATTAPAQPAAARSRLACRSPTLRPSAGRANKC